MHNMPSDCFHASAPEHHGLTGARSATGSHVKFAGGFCGASSALLMDRFPIFLSEVLLGVAVRMSGTPLRDNFWNSATVQSALAHMTEFQVRCCIASNRAGRLDERSVFHVRNRIFSFRCNELAHVIQRQDFHS